LKNITRKALAVLRLLQTKGPEADIPKRWLLHTSSRLDRQFVRENEVQVTPYGEYNRVEIQGQTLLWPSDAPMIPLLQIASELLSPGHPHHYEYRHTRVTPDDVVLDIGACEGSFAALVTSRSRHVIAVEPSKAMCDLMRKLFALRQERCPEIVNCLLGNEPSVAHFKEDLANPGASRISSQAVPGSYPVPVRTLDDLIEELAEKPTFIKCDAEGAEYGIFSGGQHFLRAFHPRLAITTYHNDRDYMEVHRLLKSLGYRVEGKGFLYTGLGVVRGHMIHAW
jgi:FkbM family methyltransferase